MKFEIKEKPYILHLTSYVLASYVLSLRLQLQLELQLKLELILGC